MNKHVLAKIRVCLEISKLSNCPRGNVGAVLIDPDTYSILADGYNGGPRGGGRLCGGKVCTRSEQGIESGTEIQVGCHHAEMNVLSNAGRAGVTTLGTTMICTHRPCLMCAKLMHHSGIHEVIVIGGSYSTNEGVDYLESNSITVNTVDVEAL